MSTGGQRLESEQCAAADFGFEEQGVAGQWLAADNVAQLEGEALERRHMPALLKGHAHGWKRIEGVGFRIEIRVGSDDRRWELWLAPDARVSIARARQIETDINAGRPEGDDALLVVPALQALPVIALGAPREDDAGPDPAQRVMLDAQAWALQRWRSGRVDAVLATADDAQAEAWEQALRAAMAAREVPVATVARVRDGEARLQLALAPD